MRKTTLLKVLALIYLVVGFGYAAGPGYFKHELLQDIEGRKYLEALDGVESAVIDVGGDIYICAFSKNLNSKTFFELKVPMKDIYNLPALSNENDIRELHELGAIVLGRKYIADACNTSDLRFSKLIVRKKKLRYSSIVSAMKEIREVDLLTDAPIEVLVVENVGGATQGNDLALIGRSMLRPESNVLLLKREYKISEGNKSLWFLIPFAFMLDMVTYPYYIYLLLGTAS